MQGQSPPSFLPMKKKTAPVKKEEGQIMPVADDSLMYLLMASVSGWERENRH